MVEVLEHKRVLKYIDRYFNTLSSVGYLSAGKRKQYLRYMFLVDFMDSFYDFFTEADYKELEYLLTYMFSGGDCLLSYPVFCGRCAVMGKPNYSDTGLTRATEINHNLRLTESKEHRGAL